MNDTPTGHDHTGQEELRVKVAGLFNRANNINPSSRSVNIDQMMQLIEAEASRQVEAAEKVTYDIAFKDGVNHVTVGGEWVHKNEVVRREREARDKAWADGWRQRHEAEDYSAIIDKLKAMKPQSGAFFLIEEVERVIAELKSQGEQG